MPMRSVRVAMRTSMRKASSAAHSDTIDRMNMQAMNAAKSQRRKALTNSITTTSEMNSADSGDECDRRIDEAGAPCQHAEHAVQVVARPMRRVIRAAQRILDRTRTIHDARQAARQHVERHSDRRDEENGRQRHLDEMGDVDVNRVRGHAVHSNLPMTNTAAAANKQ